MAVYTPLTDAEIRAHVESYPVGGLHRWHGITEGIDNTNFLLETESGRYILTLFERRVKREELPYYIGLMAHLEAKGIHCPKPVADKSGQMFRDIKGKPAVILTFLHGEGVHEVQTAHLPLVGELAARMHLAAQDFPMQRANTMSFDAWRALIDVIAPHADRILPGLAGLVGEEFQYLSSHWPAGLPAGAVHGDLFPDNVFFVPIGGAPSVSGVIDFYFACNEFWMYDLAICLCAWCFDAAHQFQPERASAMFEAYGKIRPVTAAEKQALPTLARGAALRFLLTRAHDLLFTPEGADVQPKDPLEYAQKLKWLRTGPALVEGW